VKILSSALQTHYLGGSHTLAKCLLITRADGLVLGYTTSDRPLTVLGQVYQPGLDVTNLVASAGLAVNNLDVQVLYDATFLKADFLAGRWDGARWELFELNWAEPAAGTNTIGHFITGNLSPGRTNCQIELRALSQFLQQPIGLVTSKTCRARFADFPTPIYSARCRLAAYDWTDAGSVTAVTSQQIMRDSTRTEPDDWFGEGVLTFVTGANEGLSQKVKTFEADSNGGQFTFSLPFPFAIEVSDTYTVVAGCRKRLEEDCRDKFNNVVNFQGEPHLPGIDQATASPEVGTA